MRIYLKVITGSSQQKVEKISKGDYKVWVRAIPEKGKANQEIVEILADFFKIDKQRISIISGRTTSRKLIEIDF